MYRHSVDSVGDHDEKCKDVISLYLPDTDGPQPDYDSKNQEEHAKAIKSPYLFEELSVHKSDSYVSFSL